MFANILKSRNNAKPKIAGVHLFWVRDIQSIALLFSDFLSCLFIFYHFVYTYVFMYVCFCMWVSVVCHCTRGAQSTTFQRFFSPSFICRPEAELSFCSGSKCPYPLGHLTDPCLSWVRKQLSTAKKGCWVPVSLSCLYEHVRFPHCSIEIKRSRIAYWTTAKLSHANGKTALDRQSGF